METSATIPAMTPKHVAALVDELLALLAPMPLVQRIHHVATRARELDAAGELTAVLAELSQRGTYEQGLAAVAAGAARQAGWLRTRLTDPDPYVRLQAVSAVRTGVVADDAVADALDDAPAAVRRELIRAVVAGRRTALADRLIRPLRERWGAAEAARLLPACGPGTVAGLLPGLFPSVTKWTKLCSRHAGLVLDEAERRLTAEPEALRPTWWQENAQCVAAAIRVEPLRVLDLLERLCHGPLPRPVREGLGGMMAADAGRTCRMLLAPGREPADHLGLAPSALRTLVRRDLPELTPLARALGAEDGALAHLLRQLPPSRRAACFDAATAGRDISHTALPEHLLDVLPRARREAEARRMARQARTRGARWLTVLESVAFLPPGEADTDLWAATRRSSADDRAQAYRLLFRNAGRSGDPSVVTSRLAGAGRLRNERETVRASALYAIAAIPPGLFTEEAAPHLERIATEALEARDCSWESHRALHTLAEKLLRHQGHGEETSGPAEPASWALRTLGRVPLVNGPGIRALRRGQEHAAFEALRPRLEAKAARADFAEVLSLASWLGRRAYGLPGLQELLRRATRDGDQETARRAAIHRLDDVRTRDERLAELLAFDASFATVPWISAILASRRTDLLDVVLGDTPPYGRVLPKDTHWLPPVGPSTRRWLPGQQAAAARLLDRAAGDSRLDVRQRVRALSLAAWIPGHGTDLLLRHADAVDVPVADAALAALARTDRPGERLSVLLARAGDDRAKVAMPAASRASRYVPPSELAGALRGVLLGGGVKVTSRKEAARLAAAVLPVRQAAALLGEACDHPGQHPDVQAACVAYATGLLECEEAWGVLESAAAGRRELRLAVLRTRPLDVPEGHRPRYAELIRSLCATDDPDVTLRGYTALEQWSRWTALPAGILVAAVTDLENRSTWPAAADALCAAVTTPGSDTADLTPLMDALAALMDADARAGTPDAEPDRDHPARRRVELLVENLTRNRTAHDPTRRRAARAAAELLARHQDFTGRAVHLFLHTLDLAADADTLTRDLTRLARLLEGRPALAARTAGTLGSRLRTRVGGVESFAPAARSLTEDGSQAAGLFAVELTETGGRRTDWAAFWRERLRALRRHADPDVREAALDLGTAGEWP